MLARRGGHTVVNSDPLISRALWQAQHAIEQALDALLAPHGLSTTLHGTLTFLAEAPGSSTADLARRAGVAPQSMAHAINRLEELDLIVRTPHPVHGRVMQLHPTDQGRRVLKDGAAVVARAEHELTHDLSDTERRALLDRLAVFQKRAEQLR